jgi:hypothetical protein
MAASANLVPNELQNWQSKSCATKIIFSPNFFYLLLPIPNVESWYKKERNLRC